VENLSWGGSLNENGSNYVRKLREADRVVKFLESLKPEVRSSEKKVIDTAIEIISNHLLRLSESEE
jgi:hypothetical protein